MGNVIEVRGVKIGEGVPKIIVPIVGVTKEEIAAIITHATMYVGWPKGWAVFRLAKEVWG